MQLSCSSSSLTVHDRGTGSVVRGSVLIDQCNNDGDNDSFVSAGNEIVVSFNSGEDGEAGFNINYDKMLQVEEGGILSIV